MAQTQLQRIPLYDTHKGGHAKPCAHDSHALARA